MFSGPSRMCYNSVEMSDTIDYRIYRGIMAGILLFVVALMVMAFAAFYIYTHKPLPHVQGKIELPGLEAAVVVIRDKWGVPHIYAENSNDLFFASGFVQAQDRLFQMDLLRRVCEGRLSEWFGPDSLPSDRLARVIGFHRQAKKNFKHLSPESREVIESYTTGVNAYATRRETNISLEYRMIGQEFEPWRPEDTLAVALYIGWGLTGNWQVELLRLGLLEERGDALMREIMPLYEARGPDIISTEAKPGNTLGRLEKDTTRMAWGRHSPANGIISGSGIASLLSADRSLRRFISGSMTSAMASNSWVVDGSLSASGKPILCNDPHLELTIPSVWYELHLVGAGINVIGVTFPGIPPVILGHTKTTAWAATTTMADMDDLFIEEVDPSDSGKYSYRGEWVEFEIVQERIEVRGDNPDSPGEQVLEVRISKHGPVINDVIDPKINTDKVLCLSWTGFETTDPIAAFISVAKAKDWDSFREGIQQLGCPVQNWLYADANGNIGYISAGLYPVRPRHNGSAPAPGSTGMYDWQGYVPLDELPQVKNPSTHYLVTANNRVMPSDKTPYVISYNYVPPYRASRIVELITKEKGKKWTAPELSAIQMDTTSLRARRLLPVFMAVLDKHREEDRDLERAWRQLEDWDGNMDAKKAAPSIFAETYWQAVKLTYEDEMSPELFEWFTGVESAMNAFDNILEKGESVLFDYRRTEKVEGRDDVILRAFEESLRVLTERSGPRMSTWKWGRYHRLHLVHPLGEARQLKSMANFFKVNRSPIALSGGRNTVNNGFYHMGDGYEVKVGPSMRHVVDLAQVEKATISYPGGQSGQAFSSHYADLLEFWLEGRGHPMLMSRSDIDSNMEAGLELLPEAKETQE